MSSSHWNFIFWRNGDATDCNSKFHLCQFFKKKKKLWLLHFDKFLCSEYTDCISFSIPRIFSKSFHLFLLKGEKLSYIFLQRACLHYELWLVWVILIKKPTVSMEMHNFSKKKKKRSKEPSLLSFKMMFLYSNKEHYLNKLYLTLCRANIISY